MRIERIALYVTSSLVLVLSGVLTLVLGSSNDIALAIGTSIVASGLASISFAVIRYLDDRAADSTSATLKTSVQTLGDNLRNQQRSIESLRRASVSLSGGRVRVYDRHPQDEVREELERIVDHVDIDVVGFTLRPFCQDWLHHLAERGDCKVRLVTQNPHEQLFDLVCEQESRNAVNMRQDALWVADQVAALPAEIRASVELRWYPGYPTVTMTRLNDVMFVRARFLREATQPRLFHEQYVSEDGLPFRAYIEQFETVWDASTTPTPADLAALSNPGSPGATGQ